MSYTIYDEQTAFFTFRLPESMKKRIADLAHAEHRTMGQMVVLLLDKALKEQNPEVEQPSGSRSETRPRKSRQSAS